MTDKKARPTVRVSRRLPASPERVFDAWLDPAKAMKFLFATRTGIMVKAEIDARPGGHFLFVDRRDGQDVEHVGTYLEVERPRRLVFDFAVPQFSPEHTLVTVEILAEASGSVLTLTHEGVLPDYEEKTRQGWAAILDGLAATLG